MNQIVDCRQYLKEIKEEVKEEINTSGIKATMAVIQVGDNPESNKYVGMKIKHCEEVGIKTIHVKVEEETVTTEKLVECVKTYNEDEDITSIIVQLPLPKHIDVHTVMNTIDPMKDIDCLTDKNIGLLHQGIPYCEPCTPSGIIYLLEKMEVNLKGKNVLILGRSNIVGRPLQRMLEVKNATVTLAHSHSDLSIYNGKNFPFDIIVSAVGKFKEFTAISEKAILIDVGINFDAEGNMAGDFNLDDSEFEWATPVPYGIGTLTTAMIVKHNLKLVKKQLEVI